jgi:ATP-dependent Clp protease protease subunit
VRVWADPHIAWQDKLYEQLLARRIVLASGQLDDEAAARLSAQLLTLDAEAAAQPEAPARSAEPAAQPAEPAAQPAEPAAQPAEPAARPGAPARPVRLELQNLHADLTAVITVMGILDVMRVPVHCVVSGEVAGPALGLLASCPRRTARPNAVLTLTEPKLQLSGTATAISACEQQVLRMLDTLYYRLAEATGRPADEIREDARRGRMLTAAEAIGYGLIQAQEDRSL